MKDNFLIKIETWHKPDMGHLENVRSMCVCARACANVCLYCRTCGVSLLQRSEVCSVLLFQVHGLDAETWKKVDVVYIDIADRSQVEPKVKI